LKAPSQTAIKKAMDLIDRNIVSGDIDDDTAVIITGGLIAEVADLFDHLDRHQRKALAEMAKEAKRLRLD
jgi:Mg-chelatase subunit ChlD